MEIAALRSRPSMIPSCAAGSKTFSEPSFVISLERILSQAGNRVAENFPTEFSNPRLSGYSMRCSKWLSSISRRVFHGFQLFKIKREFVSRTYMAVGNRFWRVAGNFSMFLTLYGYGRLPFPSRMRTGRTTIKFSLKFLLLALWPWNANSTPAGSTCPILNKTAVPTVTAELEDIKSRGTFAAPTIPRLVMFLAGWSPWMRFWTSVLILNKKVWWIRRI